MAKEKSSNRDQHKTVLAELKTRLHEEFPDAHARLEQLDSHLATVDMVVDHLYDEAETG